MNELALFAGAGIMKPLIQEASWKPSDAANVAKNFRCLRSIIERRKSHHSACKICEREMVKDWYGSATGQGNSQGQEWREQNLMPSKIQGEQPAEALPPKELVKEIRC